LNSNLRFALAANWLDELSGFFTNSPEMDGFAITVGP